MSKKNETLSPRFEQALVFANQAHANQKRKSSGIPYIAHILGVTSLVLEDGGSEDEAIAALLHDAPEDQGGEIMLKQIQQLFGDKVAQIVFECSDTLESPKPPWKSRKQYHLDVLQTALPETIRVMLADKVYNSTSLLHGLQEHGKDIWQNFNGDRDGTLWYYRQMLDLFKEKTNSNLVSNLENTIIEIEKIA